MKVVSDYTLSNISLEDFFSFLDYYTYLPTFPTHLMS